MRQSTCVYVIYSRLRSFTQSFIVHVCFALQEDINTVLVAECKKGHRVARLKGGDPLVFGRVWPEIEALNAAGCQYDVIPGRLGCETKVSFVEITAPVVIMELFVGTRGGGGWARSLYATPPSPPPPPPEL